MNKNDWQKRNVPDTVDIICENNRKSMTANVIDMNDRLLIAAIQGVKITLISQHENGVYAGKMGGLDLIYRSK
jgi:hypothetical protein